jgi:hypothetical protein
VDRLLRQPPFHIDGKGLRAYRSLEKMAAKVSKEPIPEVLLRKRSQVQQFGRQNC